MDTTVARYIGLGAMIVFFVVTVLLMPRIFGTNPSPEDER
jgi:hypothetical protein